MQMNPCAPLHDVTVGAVNPELATPIPSNILFNTVTVILDHDNMSIDALMK